MIADHCSERITFIEIYELNINENGEEKRVILFQIPSAVPSIPTALKGHYYGRDGESLVSLNIYEIEHIRGQGNQDWSKQIVEAATICDLDKGAMKKLSMDEGIEFWYARELQTVLEYTQWRNFESVIDKAKIACNASGNNTLNHFADVSKMVASGISQKEINGFQLSRYACYLIVQNGDTRKEVIALRYFETVNKL